MDIDQVHSPSKKCFQIGKKPEVLVCGVELLTALKEHEKIEIAS